MPFVHATGRSQPGQPERVSAPIWGLPRRPATSPMRSQESGDGPPLSRIQPDKRPLRPARLRSPDLWCHVMDDPERQRSASDLPRDEAKAGSKIMSLLLMSAITVTMAAWIIFLGWAARSILGDG